MIQIPLMMAGLASLSVSQKAAKLAFVLAIITLLAFFVDAAIATASSIVSGFVSAPPSYVLNGLALMPTNTMACLEVMAATYLSRWLFDAKILALDILSR